MSAGRRGTEAWLGRKSWWRSVLVGVGLLLLPGCTTVGVLATTDPDKKLQDALSLLDEGGRPLMCEPLIREALATYEQRGDQKGLGNAYRVYGVFLPSPSVTRWERWYRQHGSQDTSVPFDGRFAKAIEYFERAEPLLRDTGQFDLLTGVYYHQAFALEATGQHARACASLVQALEAYQENMRRNPAATPNTAGFASVPEVIEDGKRRVGLSIAARPGECSAVRGA